MLALCSGDVTLDAYFCSLFKSALCLAVHEDLSQMFSQVSSWLDDPYWLNLTFLPVTLKAYGPAVLPQGNKPLCNMDHLLDVMLHFCQTQCVTSQCATSKNLKPIKGHEPHQWSNCLCFSSSECCTLYFYSLAHRAYFFMMGSFIIWCPLRGERNLVVKLALSEWMVDSFY